jgi:general secretion pathway protein K
MRSRHSPANQLGMAVISAMLIAALVAAMASYLLFEQQLVINQVDNHLSASQARRMSNAAIEWSRAIMAEDAKLGPIDHLHEAWARKLPATPFESGLINGFILDEQAFFNLNNLSQSNGSNEAALQALKLFMAKAGGNPEAVNALVDWIDKDREVTLPNGAEDNAYIAQAAPYKTANQLLTEIGNLSRVMGFNNNTVARNTQYFVVLPEVTPINFNTASAEVLRLAFPALGQLELDAIMAQRNIAPFQNTAELMGILGDKAKVAENQIAVGSRYFLVNTQAVYGKTTVNVSALLKRDGAGWPKIIWKKYT